MSTYTDKHNMIKENVAVDYHSRITRQCVKLQNESNEYWGTFHGKTVQDAFIATPGLRLKHKGYDCIADLFADGTGKGKDYVLKAHQVWRLIEGHDDQKTYIVDGLTIDVGDIFIVKKDMQIADMSKDDVEFIHNGFKVNVIKQDVPDEGYAATYYITQDGRQVGQPIEILSCGSSASYSAGNGLVLSGNEFSISASVLDKIDDTTAKLNAIKTELDSILTASTINEYKIESMALALSAIRKALD